jgi:BolA protein
MNISQLIISVKSKIENNFQIQDIDIEDKTFLHKSHKSHKGGKFHIKLIIKSNELNNTTKIDSTKRIYKILEYELKNYIHSIQILIK